MRLADVENHAEQCAHRRVKPNQIGNRTRNTAESTICESCGEIVDDETHNQVRKNSRLICPNITIACPFTSAGCEDKVPRKDLGLHVQKCTNKHMQLLCEKLLKLQQMQSVSACDDSDLAERETESLSESGDQLRRLDGVRLSGSNMQATQKLLKDLYQRVVQLEQKNRKLEIVNEQLSMKLQEKISEDVGRYCNGNYVWTIKDFNHELRKMKGCNKKILFSPGFYSSPFGYKVCLRCKVGMYEGEEYLDLYIHMMSGENDDNLDWPFKADITFSLVNLGTNRLHREQHSETIYAETQFGDRKSLMRPAKGQLRNCDGLGFPEFIRINSLYTGGFLDRNNTLVIRVNIQTVDDI